MAMTAGYEAVREASRRYEARQSTKLQNMHSKYNAIFHGRLGQHQWTLLTSEEDHTEYSSLLTPGSSLAAEEQTGHLIKAAFYGVQVFYSFFIM